jgi:arginine decarboxylase-like protein
LFGIQLTEEPAESVVARQAVGQHEEAAQKRLFRLGEQRHLDRALSAAQDRAERDQQEFVEIVKSRVPASRILPFLPAFQKLIQHRLQRLDARLQR